MQPSNTLCLDATNILTHQAISVAQLSFITEAIILFTDHIG